MAVTLKIIIKTGLIAVVTAAIIILFATFKIPGLDFTVFTQAIGTGLAVVYHYVPVSQQLFPIAVSLLSLELAISLFQLGMIAVRWIFKVNE